MLFDTLGLSMAFQHRYLREGEAKERQSHQGYHTKLNGQPFFMNWGFPNIRQFSDFMPSHITVAIGKGM